MVVRACTCTCSNFLSGYCSKLLTLVGSLSRFPPLPPGERTGAYKNTAEGIADIGDRVLHSDRLR